MMRPITLSATFFFALSAYDAHAAGDPAKGESAFNKCKACHSITAADGTAIVKGGKVGPDMFGVIGRAAGTSPEYAYGDAIRAAGAGGLIWDEVSIAAYLVDPAAFLQAKTGDAGAKSKMTFKLAKGGEDIAAYLATFK